MFAELENTRLHYQVVGEGKPIILLHGFFGISDGMMEIFEPIFSGLEGWKRIYLDSPGNGKSDAPDWINSSEQVLEVVQQFIDFAIPEQNFLLVGYSYGGYLSMGLVHRQPERIDGLALLCPLVEPDESIRHMPKLELRKIDPTFYESLDTTVQDGFKSGEMGVVALNEHWMKRAEKIYTPAFRVANANFLNRIHENAYKSSFDIYNLSEPFENPSLVVTGLQDNSVGYLDAMNLHSQFKRATFVALDAAGHGLPLDQDALFTVLVREWIQRVEHFDYDSKINRPSTKD